jgi:hypothetical protein
MDILINKINNMNQIIGGYKEFIVIDRVAISDLEKQADTLDTSDEVYSSIRAGEIRRVVEFIKERNIYGMDFHIKG